MANAGSSSKLVNPRDDVDAAEKALLAGHSSSTLSSRFNVPVFVALCHKLGVEVAGKKSDIIKELIAWVSGSSPGEQS